MRSSRLALLALSMCFISSAFAGNFGFTSDPAVQVDATGYLVSKVSYQIQSKLYQVYFNAGDVNPKLMDNLCTKFRFNKARTWTTMGGNGVPMSFVVFNGRLNVVEVYENTSFTGVIWQGVSGLICEY